MTTKCKICDGHGLWSIGDDSPMGSLDYEEGYPNKKCPKCGSGGHK